MKPSQSHICPSPSLFASAARRSTTFGRAWLPRTCQHSAWLLALFAHPIALAQSPAADGTIHWPRQDLIIPFHVDLTGQPPAEIQLEVSEDRGQSWSLYQRSDVRGRQFNFHATRDGEYLFRLKTLDRYGAPLEQPGEPMRILIDTTKPTGELLIDMDPKGNLQGEFRLIDSALDTASVRMEYQTESDSSWREVRVDLERGIAPGEWVGFGTWSIPDSTAQIIVRVTARDAAGNPVELTRMPRLPRSAANPTAVKLASNRPEDPNQPIGAGLARRFPTQRTQAAAHPQPLALAPPPTQPATPATTGAAPINLGFSSQVPTPQSPSPQAPRLVSTTGIPLRSVDAAPDSANAAPIAFPQPNANAPIATPIDSTQSLRTPQSLLIDRSAPSALMPSLPGPSNASLSVGDPSASQLNNTSIPALPAVPPQRLSNRWIDQALHSSSKAFSLDYAIENDPGAPVASVELWGTTDEGRTWDRWGVDSDRESPFDIEVETEGLFGFRMVIVGANGLASRRPLPGDAADSWINVDTTLPRAQLLSALNGKGPDAGSLVIEFQALDDHFTERPISLFYSETPKGPWLPITQGARNNGRFVWPSDPNLPEKVYLRLEAVDAAGNIGAHQLEMPVDVAGAAPRGRIQGFRPLKP